MNNTAWGAAMMFSIIGVLILGFGMGQTAISKHCDTVGAFVWKDVIYTCERVAE